MKISFPAVGLSSALLFSGGASLLLSFGALVNAQLNCNTRGKNGCAGERTACKGDRGKNLKCRTKKLHCKVRGTKKERWGCIATEECLPDANNNKWSQCSIREDSASPTDTPSNSPTAAPTEAPTNGPSSTPSTSPTDAPSASPITVPPAVPVTEVIYSSGKLEQPTVSGTVTLVPGASYSVQVEILRNDLSSDHEEVTAIYVDGIDMGGCNPDGGDYDCTFYQCSNVLASFTPTTSTVPLSYDITGHSWDCDCDMTDWTCSMESTVAGRTPMTATARYTFTPVTATLD